VDTDHARVLSKLVFEEAKLVFEDDQMRFGV